MSIHPAMKPVRKMVQCEGIVSLAMPCLKHEPKQAATPPAKWITHGYFADQILYCKPFDQPAQNILPSRQFCSLLG